MEWPMIRATKNVIADVFWVSLKITFCRTSMLRNRHERQYTLLHREAGHGFYKGVERNQKTVLTYAPTFSGRAEQMVATIKEAVGRLAHKRPADRYKFYEKVALDIDADRKEMVHLPLNFCME